MQTETEVKFLNVDLDAFRTTLRNRGAACVHEMRLLRRVVMDYPNHRLGKEKDAFVRVRDEGGGLITKTFKVAGEKVAGGAKEISTKVDSYELEVEFLKAIGLVIESSQESKRETWNFADCEIVLDVWPWLKPYIEIEGPSEKVLRKTAEYFGFNWSDAVFGSTTVAYQREYPGIKDGETIAQIPVMRFGDPLPEWLESRKYA